MPTYRLELAYDGSGFRGYARQNGVRTVQGELEDVLERILGERPKTSVAGRTDAGVHARSQVVSLTAPSLDTDRLVRSLNSMLGGEIVVRSCGQVDPSFDARFSAKSRTYRYRANLGGVIDPLERNSVWTFPVRVDVASLHLVAEHFVGEIDFTSFCRSVAGKSNVRKVEVASWNLDGERADFWVKANSFCHQMVRSLVGMCFDVARGYTALSEVREIIDRADRSTMGSTVAPPHGLILWDVEY